MIFTKIELHPRRSNIHLAVAYKDIAVTSETTKAPVLVNIGVVRIKKATVANDQVKHRVTVPVRFSAIAVQHVIHLPPVMLPARHLAVAVVASARQKTPGFAQRQRGAAIRRCQPGIAYASIGRTHGRTNFRRSGTESRPCETERNNREENQAARRSRRRSCRCNPMQIRRENRQRDRRNRRLHAYEHGRDHVVRDCL